MVVAKTMRLSKLAREFNVGIHTLVEFLHQKGLDIDSNPNTKISLDAVRLLESHYKVDISLKKQSEKLSLKSHRPKKEVINIENNVKVNDSQAQKSNSIPETTVKVIGKIDLDQLSKPKKIKVTDKSDHGDTDSKKQKNKAIDISRTVRLELPGKAIRLTKLARHFNVGTYTIVEFLQKKGFELNSNPNTKVTEEAVRLLETEYDIDIYKKVDNNVENQSKDEAPEIAIERKEVSKPIEENTDTKKITEEKGEISNTKIEEKPISNKNNDNSDNINQDQQAGLNISETEESHSNEKDVQNNELHPISKDIETSIASNESTFVEKKYDDFGFGEENFKNILELLELRKQIILQGAPGTGKSFLADILANRLTDNKQELSGTIQFHSSYSYEDFMEGYKPGQDNSFVIKPGIFKSTCKLAIDNPTEKIVLIIDEINRGDTSKIFGELLFLLEYRGKSITLSHSGKSFKIPENIYIIGTMNTADRSLALVDFALRRRFAFITLNPLYEVISQKYNIEDSNQIDINQLVSNLKKVNQKINNNLSLGSGFQIGHSYFLRNDILNSQNFANIWKFDLLPLLNEYYHEDTSEISEIEKLLFSKL